MGRDSGSDTLDPPLVPKYYRRGYEAGFKDGANYQCRNGTPNWTVSLYAIHDSLERNPKLAEELRVAYYLEGDLRETQPIDQLEQLNTENRALHNKLYALEQENTRLRELMLYVARYSQKAKDQLEPVWNNLVGALNYAIDTSTKFHEENKGGD